MTSRKRKNSSTSRPASRTDRSRWSTLKTSTRVKRRKHLLEKLESRQLLAGPQLIGIQPNEGDLIVNGSELDTAPRVLTLRFDEGQQIDPATLEGVRITRAGEDGLLGSEDDVQIEPGLVTLGDARPNEVVVRFSETLPDDLYKVEVFGFDDSGLGVTGLRNLEGEFFQPSAQGQRVEVTNFDLRLGALVESVVPQPVVRQPDGSLVQNRNEIVVYFNEDPLFVEDDSASGTIEIGNEEITVTADLVERSFDDTQILFRRTLVTQTPSAEHDPDARTVTVTYSPGATFAGIANAINALPGFDALVTAGNPDVVFVAPQDSSILYEIKGNATQRSAEHPRFYQLLLTQDTVRTTDDALYHPDEVIYDPVTHTARLFFKFNADGTPVDDINELGPDADGNAGVALGGGTFRLRIGTAVDNRVDLILPPLQKEVAASTTTDFGIDDFAMTFTSQVLGEGGSGRQVYFVDSGSDGPNAGLSVDVDADGNIVFDFGGTVPRMQDLVTVAESTPIVQSLITVTFASGGVEGVGGLLPVPSRVIGAPALTMTAVGDTLGTALDVGVFGSNDELTTVILSESISPQAFDIELPGGNDDPGHVDVPESAGNLLQHINDAFGPDTRSGITEISYNFNGIFDQDFSGNTFLNQITERQKTRIREALGLWANKIGVQFRETADQGITFALGSVDDLQPRPGIFPVNQFQLNARLRIDPTFNESAVVFSNEQDFQLAYGEDFLRKATAAIGLILGLEQTPDLPSQTLMALDPVFLNDTINHVDPLTSEVDPINVLPDQASLRDLEPSFPGNHDILHGNYVHRSDSIDIDLYRFEVNLNDADRLGTLTAETFAERLSDSSLLDTTLTLFEEHRASVLTDFQQGTELSVAIDSMLEGRLGNNSRIDFIQSDRPSGDSTVRISRVLDSAGNFVPNGILIDIPRRGQNIDSVPVGDVIDAINNDPFASSIFVATLITGNRSDDISGSQFDLPPLLLSGGGVQQLSRNDDYFSEDSRIIASLDAGTYYIGVAASGNDNYDPTIPGSGYGGRTQGRYDLHLKFEPQVDEVDVIRDLDSSRVDVPGTQIDGDGDGRPGGVNNFWFQTRPLNRLINFTENGAAVTEGQTITVTGGNGVVRTYEFVPLGQSPRPGNVAVLYNPGTTGFPTPPSSIASALQSAVNSRRNETGVSITTDGTTVIFIGERSIATSTDFRGGDVLGRNLFVDKTAGPLAEGSLDRPFNNIANSAVANAFDSALPGDIVRIVGNGGADQDITTEADNFSYQIGISDTGGQTLEDGDTMEVPQGVTTMIDAGAVLKLRSARIGVGSSSVQFDRSGGALQVLGTPRLVQLSLKGQPVKTTIIGDENVNGTGFDDGKVIFTSTRDRDADAAAAGINPPASVGNWGGLVYRRDVDQAEGRRDLEDEGIFLQHVNHADIRYGGTSNIFIDSVQQTVNPIQIINLRPTIAFSEISFSADAAISAAPNSFEETSFQTPEFQINGAFTADYSRIGPDIHNNLVINNSLNGVFVRSTTTPVSIADQVTTTVRFDDSGIVHIIAENLLVAGNPGGPITDGFAPSLSATSGRAISGGRIQPADYQYRMTFIDSDGFESLSSADADSFNITVPSPDSSVELIGLPVVDVEGYVSRRLYRADVSGGGTPVFELIATLDASTQSFIDDGTTLGGILDLNGTGTRGRLDGSLVFDPGVVVKLQGSRIELGQGTQLLAEGTQQNPVVFTSTLDDRFGAGGTFDTNNDNNLSTPPAVADRGNWSGIYGGPTSRISIDNGFIAYGGGISLIGGESRGFAPIELQQADGRITNTRFEFNDDGQDGSGETGREGRLGITPSTIFVRGAQPIIVGNDFIDNRGTVIGIDSDSMIADYVLDVGRHTGSSERLRELDDNHGPLIRHNRYESVPTDDKDERQISALDIRGGVLTTESVWDDTDIVHLFSDTISVGNFHSSGGLLLKSRPEESLVVKITGGELPYTATFGTAGGTPNSPTYGTGLTATGTPGDIEDRIGGSLRILGLPGAPVVLTSFADDTVGAGLAPDGTQFTDTNGDSFGSRPEPNDWRSILLDQWANDRNVDFILEQELSTAVAPGFNSTTGKAQVLGELAASIDEGDDTRRIGFEVEGFLSGPTDVDVYSFVGSPGAEVWLDVDSTLFQLDTVVELLDVNGNLLGRSDNSFAEISGDEDLLAIDLPGQRNVGTLQASTDEYTEFGAGGLYEDFGSTNPRDAGLRFTLPGTEGPNNRSVYFFRVRSSSVNPDDASGGLTGGGYRFQVRLQEDQEFAGSVVRFADIRYANHGIHVRGLPGESPLLGDAQENEGLDSPIVGGFFGSFIPSSFVNDQIDTSSGSFTNTAPPGIRPQNLGNLVNNKKNVISVGGRLDSGGDVDFYQVDLDFDLGTEEYQSTIFDIDYADGSRPDTNLSVFYDPDGEFGPESPRLVLFSENANIAEDRTSPLGENDAIERLMRGSSGDGDAFIGPVSLPEGAYYVAVTESTSIPTELTDNILVRREPINSVQRLFEDRVNPAPSSTASGPRFPELFTDTAITNGGFVVTGLRGAQAGHGQQQNFDNSNAGINIPETIYQEGFAPIGFDIGDSPFFATDIDSLDWSIADNNEIGGLVTGGFFGTGTSENTSTLIPHVTIDASMAFDAADFLQIVVPEDNTRVIVDVDNGWNPFQGIDDDDDTTPIFVPDPDSVDVNLVLIESTGAGLQFVTPQIDDSDPNDGREGSPPDDADGDGVADFPLTSPDPFFDGILDAGLYFIGIIDINTTVTIDNNAGTISITNNNLPVSGEYRVHVSVEDHPLPQGISGNESLFFPRAPGASGQLVSEPFDLTGYSPDDQPRFYFNYLYNPGVTDTASYTITSDQNPTGQNFVDLAFGEEWRQNIVPLNDFAGHTNIQFTFDYASGVGVDGEGLFLDDFVVGFSERGETVFNARGDEDDFSFGFGNTGEYQLEVRKGTDFADTTSSFFGGSSQTLVADFDTNDRHSQDITIVAPSGSQINDGDTFLISDGSVTQRFEFTSDAVTEFSNVAIFYSDADSAITVAERIRSAINQSTVLDVEAASSDGVDTGPMTNNLLNLFGAVDGSFEEVNSGQPVPTTLSVSAAGDIQIPAIMHDGVGDENYQRIQSAVIIENNVISDVQAMGVWSETGDRDVDPEDQRSAATLGFFGGIIFNPFFNPFFTTGDPSLNPHPFLQQPPVGNSYPGAARNLPTLNDSVLGGVAPGVVVRNNTVDQAGLAGIKVDGETRPFVIDGFIGAPALEGDLICDGLAMAIDAGGTRVVFEFEDVTGAPTAACGSGTIGGDGYTDGHVPIYYRRSDGGAYNDAPDDVTPYSSWELALAIKQAIQGSILVTNGMAELVTPYIAPSPNFRDEFAEQFARTDEAFPTAAVYLTGVSNIYFTTTYQNPRGGLIPNVSLAPIGETVQPLAKLVNNTIYGDDGTESEFFEDPADESNDLLDEALVTNVGRAHTGPYQVTGTIGDVAPGAQVTPENDVDIYEVNLTVGDRLIVDIDTFGGNAVDTSVRIFNEFGIAQVLDVVNTTPITVNTEGVAPPHLDPQSTVNNPVNDTGNTFDPFIDFTVLETGTYYVAVSSAGNTDYDPNSVSGRVNGAGGTGDYNIGIEVYAPRTSVISLNDDSFAIADSGGTLGADVIGTTFTVTQIPDFPAGTPGAVGNQMTFAFGGGVPGAVPIPIQADWRVSNIMRAIADAINGTQSISENTDFPRIGNHENGNGPQGRSGPVDRGRAWALGGLMGDNHGIVNLSRRPIGFTAPPETELYILDHDRLPGPSDFIYGFGHDRREGTNGADVAGDDHAPVLATTELYVLFENIAEISLSPEAVAAGFKLTPDENKQQFAQNADQLITEAGIWVAGGASPTLLNNVISNVHQSVLVEETNDFGFGKRVTVFGDEFVKPQEVLLVGTAFKNDEERNTEIRFDTHWLLNDTSISTDDVTGATNVADQNDDFNFVLADDEQIFINAAGNDFLPSDGSFLIDSAINSVDDRDEFVTVKNAVGLPASNILAPSRDVRGVLRVDNPFFATPGALGFSVFKDRGSNELADFVGPFATAEVARDNDADGVDTDPAVGFINLKEGVLQEFRIQIRDTGDESDPFTGFGVDDRTIVVPEIPGLRKSGANVTLFEDDRLLEEGIDYTFNFDETKNIITLTPLAGVWQSDRSYRIALNNQDRTVLVAPEPGLVGDGDQVSIVDSNGGTLVFEFESGYSLLTPEPITLIVPNVGTNAGGLSDGDIFQINDNSNPIVVFEFNSDTATLPGSIPIQLPDRPTPTDEDELQTFLEEIATNIEAAIQSQIDAELLDVDVRRIGSRVVVGGEPATTAVTSGSGLQQLPRTLALQVPGAGIGPGGIADGDTFILDNGTRSITFEFDTNGGFNPANTAIPVGGLIAATDVALAIRDTVAASPLGLNPSIAGSGLDVYLNLPLDGSATVPAGQLTLVGISRPADDADLIEITPNNGDPPIFFEINRIDERDINGDPIDPLNGDGVTDPTYIPINIDRATTADELAGRIVNAIQGVFPPIAGLNPDELQIIEGGLLTIGGQEGLGFEVTGTAMEVTGSPSVTGKSTVEVFGPLLLNLPLVGGGGIVDHSVLVLTDDQNMEQIFEFTLTTSTPTVPNSIPVFYDTFSTVDQLANSLVTEINAANLGITAVNLGAAPINPVPGAVSLGRIDSGRVNINGIPDPNDPTQSIPGLDGVTLRRGIVNDGEVLTIRQGSTSVSFEFELAVGGGGTAPNNVPVAFESGSTVGDIAVSLAAAINNNKGNLRISAEAELDSNGVPTGQVLLDDQPGTIIDVSLAPTLNVTGVPGGATPVVISPAFSATEVKLALIDAINSVNEPGELPVTTLSAEDRGGATFFVSNGQIFTGPLENYALPAITDLAGNPLEANREDLSTQFTILMPTVGLDFGDAPDPVLQVRGRYPTRNINDGPRHVVDGSLTLGSFVDADVDGVPGNNADGDDMTIAISSEGLLFATSLVDGLAQIDIQSFVNPLDRDGDTITIDTGVAIATLEFDVNGRFEEDNYAIRPDDPSSVDSITAAIIAAIEESPLEPANVFAEGPAVMVDSDDEDGVIFTSETNPSGVLNHGVSTPIEVSVTGAGVLEAWIDFNADGDWDDPGEQIIPMPDNQIFNDLRNELCPAGEEGVRQNIFADTGEASSRTFCIVVPPTTPVPPTAVTTYARFRVSREGGLRPDGLALSGETEDYALTLLPGLPPQIGEPNRSFSVDEDRALQALDADGVLTPTTDNDNGLLTDVIDLQGDNVVIYREDIGVRTLMNSLGTEVAGVLDLSSDGTFTFQPTDDFNGTTGFTVRVSDVQPLDPTTELVNSQPISVTITVQPVNDPPELADPGNPAMISRDINEDEVQFFSVDDMTIGQEFREGLIGDKYVSGPANEGSQPLIIQSAGSSQGAFLTEKGGTLAILDGGRTVAYTPPMDYNGADGDDSFTYVVADIPGGGQLSEAAAELGTVVISFNAVNDPPRPQNDVYQTSEGATLVIPIMGDPTNPGILDNDSPGPQDEIDDGDSITLDTSAFPLTTLQGGTVSLQGNELIYEPAELFSGVDVFNYTVLDSFNASASAQVSITVGGVNNEPRFIGIDGDPTRTSLERDEAKVQAEQQAFDLTTWFSDPEDDPLTFTAVTDDGTVVTATVFEDTLVLEYQPFASGDVNLTVTARDVVGASKVQVIPVTVNPTPDPPSVIGTLNPLSGTEDQIVVADLTTVFFDPDQEPLQYLVARLGNVTNPSAAQIAAHPLVDSITFVGDQMQIRLKPDQFGDVEIEIAATDGSFRVSDSFELNVAPVPDNPVAVADGYNVPVGAVLQVVNPNSGLLRNDSDADGDDLRVDLSSVTSPALGTVTVNQNGTFTYTSTSGNVNDVDSFSYRVLDETGRPSNTVTVSFTLNQSRYQNPLVDLAEDVTADGNVTVLDALRIINFLGRELNGGSSVPVSEIGEPPPDYYDTTGDGRVSANDALRVINKLARLDLGEAEFVQPTATQAAIGVTVSNVGAGNNLPSRNLEPAIVDDEDDSLDQIMAQGFEVASASADHAVAALAEESEESSDESVDLALSSLFDDDFSSIG